MTPCCWMALTSAVARRPVSRGSSPKYSKLRPLRATRVMFRPGPSSKFSPRSATSWPTTSPNCVARAGSQEAAMARAAGMAVAGCGRRLSPGPAPTGPLVILKMGIPSRGTSATSRGCSCTSRIWIWEIFSSRVICWTSSSARRSGESERSIQGWFVGAGSLRRLRTIPPAARARQRDKGIFFMEDFGRGRRHARSGQTTSGSKTVRRKPHRRSCGRKRLGPERGEEGRLALGIDGGTVVDVGDGGGEVALAPAQNHLFARLVLLAGIGDQIHPFHCARRVVVDERGLVDEIHDQRVVLRTAVVLHELAAQPLLGGGGVGLHPFTKSALDHGGAAVLRREGLAPLQGGGGVAGGPVRRHAA